MRRTTWCLLAMVLFFWSACVMGQGSTPSLSNFFQTRGDSTSEGNTNDNPFKLLLALDRADGEYVPGENLRLKIMTERSGFLYIIAVSGEKQTLIFPNSHSNANQIPAGTAFIYPALTSPFAWRVSGKPGLTESVMAVVAERPLNLKSFGIDELQVESTPISSNPLEVVPNFKIAQTTVSYKIVEQHGTTSDRPKRVAMLFTQSHMANKETGKKEPDRNIEFRIGNHIHIKNALKQYGKIEQYYYLAGEDFVKNKIRDALVMLAKNTSPGDEIFIYWEGHGGTGIRDTSGTEPDNKHEYLCLYDFYTNDKNGYIQDDEFADMLLALKDRKVMILMESCHSGGLMEGGARNLDLNDYDINSLDRYCRGNIDYSELLRAANDLVLDARREESSGSAEINLSEFFQTGGNATTSQAENTDGLAGFFKSLPKEEADAPLFIANVMSRIKTLAADDIRPNTPNLAIIFSCSKHESSYCATIGSDGKPIKIKDSEGVERLIGPPIFCLLLAMTDTEGKYVRDRRFARFDDVWNLAKDLIPANAKRIAQLYEKERDSTQVPVYMNTIPDICVRPQNN